MSNKEKEQNIKKEKKEDIVIKINIKDKNIDALWVARNRMMCKEA